MSFVLTICLHYWSNESFFDLEERLVGRTNAPLNYVLGNRAKMEHRTQNARIYFQRASSLIPVAGLEKSLISRVLWTASLYEVYELSRLFGDRSTANGALRELMSSDSYPATAACLEDRVWPLKDCLTPNRIRVFCEMENLRQTVAHLPRDAFPVPPRNPRIDTAKLCEPREMRERLAP